MDAYEERTEGNSPRLDVRTSFFTRKLAFKFEQRGGEIPSSVMAFLDTPLYTFSETQRIYFEEKFCPQIPSLASILEELFNEMGADREGWEDMITYSGNLDTPIKICARAVLAKKEKEAGDVLSLSVRQAQRTKKITLPPQFEQLNPTTC
jgi:hypothetical protein